MNTDIRLTLKDKKRIIIKIGYSSLTHPETGDLNLMKIEKLRRSYQRFKSTGERRNPGILRSHCCRPSGFGTQRQTGYPGREAGLCGSRTGQADDGVPEAVF